MNFKIKCHIYTKLVYMKQIRDMAVLLVYLRDAKN